MHACVVHVGMQCVVPNLGLSSLDPGLVPRTAILVSLPCAVLAVFGGMLRATAPLCYSPCAVLAVFGGMLHKE